MSLFSFRKSISNKTIFFVICAVILCLIMSKNYVWFENTEGTRKSGDLVYMLLWTNPNSKPFSVMKKGQKTFFERCCSVTNCYVTSNKTLLSDVTAFDAILFNGPDLNHLAEYLNNGFIPKQRSPYQKYVFVSKESSSSYPITDGKYDHFFNWTWTYKLTSDAYFGSIIIKNKRGDVIGPRPFMPWLHPYQMARVDHLLMKKLKSKSIAAAWFDWNCESRSNRKSFEMKIKKYLARYKMKMDVFGNCGKSHFPVDNMTDFLRTLEKDYYFYLSFENSSREDYVSEQVLHALQHITIPIVLGGADYSRFLPPSSYLSAQNITAGSLVKKMVDIIKKGLYHKYFGWTNHYTYHHVQESPETDVYCKFCKKINEEKSMDRKSYYSSFRQWWNK